MRIEHFRRRWSHAFMAVGFEYPFMSRRRNLCMRVAFWLLPWSLDWHVGTDGAESPKNRKEQTMRVSAGPLYEQRNKQVRRMLDGIRIRLVGTRLGQLYDMLHPAGLHLFLDKPYRVVVQFKGWAEASFDFWVNGRTARSVLVEYRNLFDPDLITQVNVIGEDDQTTWLAGDDQNITMLGSPENDTLEP